MSRSNPSEHLANPSTRWFEWHGEKGLIRYYNRETKVNVDVPLPFRFLLLDELASVRGWHDPSSSGIYSNEVRDTAAEILVVKSFKGGTIAEGLYKAIKDRVNAAGGDYTANCYIAYKADDNSYALGSLRLKGAALGGWMEFRKAHRSAIYQKAIRITGYTEGKKGKVTFRVPTFECFDVSADAEAAAVGLDKELQTFLGGYLKKNKTDQADTTEPAHLTDEQVAYDMPPVTADEIIPF